MGRSTKLRGLAGSGPPQAVFWQFFGWVKMEKIQKKIRKTMMICDNI
jgi:hypothetical protein